MQTNDFVNKVAIVTGATGGIGEAIVADLAAQGCAVFAVGRNAQKLAELSQKHQGLAGPIQWVSEDLVQAQAPSRVVKGVLAWKGALNILVNCAGATKRGDFETLSDEDALDGFQLKLHAAVRLCREACTTYAIRQPRASIKTHQKVFIFCTHKHGDILQLSYQANR